MNQKISSIFWGLLLILGGLAALAQTQGYLNDFPPVVWSIVFAVISIVALGLYIARGVKHWEMLFPVGIFGALAIMLAFAASGVDHPVMAAPLFIGIGIPFVLAFSLDRAKNWWALIPAGVMGFLIFATLAAENMRGEVIGSALFFILAAAFGFVYAARRVLWAAIVAYVMFVMGFMPLMALTNRPEIAGALTIFGVALPFWLIYLRGSPERWWAIIPAGVLTTAGILTAIVLLSGMPAQGYDSRLANAFMYLGLAATFAVVWLRHHKGWAMIFMVIAAGMGVFAALVNNDQFLWPAALVAVGIYLVFRNIRGKTS